MNGKKDLRTIRTETILKNNLKELLMEKEFEKISVQELCEKSLINRRTFYLHYDSIDDLLLEILEEISIEFIEYTRDYDHFAELDRIVSDYFQFTNTHPLYQKLNLDSNLSYIREQITDKVIAKTGSKFKRITNYDSFTKSALAIYLNATTVNMYKLWSKNKDVIPMDKVISLTATLLKSGLSNM